MTAVTLQNPDLLRRLAGPNPIPSYGALATELEKDPANLRKTLKRLEGEGTVQGFGLTDLGRRVLAGLDIAEGRTDAATAGPGDFVRLHPSQLRPDPDQPRKAFGAAELEALAQSIADKGVLQPILARPAAPVPATDDAYPGEAHMIIAGERRWRACMKIVQSGEWPDDRTVTVRIAPPEDEAEAFETAVVENMQRENLNHMEMGLAFERMAGAGRTNKEIAESVGKTPEFVQQHRRLIKLSAEDQARVASGALVMHDALQLLRPEKEAKAAPAVERVAPDHIIPETYSEWVLPNPKPGWQGVPDARIEVGQVIDGGWTFATGVQIKDEGRSYGLGHHGARTRQYETREEAIGWACEELGAGLGGHRPQRLMAWLEEVRETQGAGGVKRVWTETLRDEHPTKDDRFHRSPAVLRHMESNDGQFAFITEWTASDRYESGPFTVTADIEFSPNRGLMLSRAIDRIRRMIGKDMTREVSEWLDERQGPFVVDGVDFYNLGRAKERRIVLGWDPAPRAAGGSAKSSAPEPSAPLTKRQRLIMIELAHKVAEQKRPFDATGDDQWTGNAEVDLVAFGANVGSYWLDQGFNELSTMRLIRAGHQAGATAPIAGLTAKGVEWFVAEGVPLPPDGYVVSEAQRACGAGQINEGKGYATPWLKVEAQAPGDIQTPTGDAPTAAANDDPWDRTAEQIEADEGLLKIVTEWVDARDPLHDAAQLFADLGVHGVAVNADGWVELLGAGQDVVTTLTVDPHNALPDERVRAIELLIGIALNRALGHE